MTKEELEGYIEHSLKTQENFSNLFCYMRRYLIKGDQEKYRQYEELYEMTKYERVVEQRKRGYDKYRKKVGCDTNQTQQELCDEIEKQLETQEDFRSLHAKLRKLIRNWEGDDDSKISELQQRYEEIKKQRDKKHQKEGLQRFNQKLKDKGIYKEKHREYNDTFKNKVGDEKYKELKKKYLLRNILAPEDWERYGCAK